MNAAVVREVLEVVLVGVVAHHKKRFLHVAVRVVVHPVLEPLESVVVLTGCAVRRGSSIGGSTRRPLLGRASQSGGVVLGKDVAHHVAALGVWIWGTLEALEGMLGALVDVGGHWEGA